MERIFSLEPATQLMVALLLWLWWDERNKRREEGRRRSGSEVAYIAAAMANRLKQNIQCKPGAPRLLSENIQRRKWRKPNPEYMKLNTDGTFREQSGEGGWGFVIRDHLGAAHKSGAGKEFFLQSAFHAELLGCLEGLKAAAAMGIARIALETDALMVKCALEGEEYRLSPLGGFITDVKHLMASEFVICKFSYCPRECNSLAHELESFGCKLSGTTHAIRDGVPQQLEDLVISDSAETEE